MAIVELDVAQFRDMYEPKFDSLSDARIQGGFETACLIVDNTETSRIPYDPDSEVYVRRTLLYLLMCHILTLSMLPNGVAGPMTSATQGTVSVGYGTLTVNDGKWYSLTPCGQAFWQAVLPWLIGGRYYPKKTFHPWG